MNPASKGFLRRIYEEHYLFLLSQIPCGVNGPAIELGSGSGFLKQYAPKVITSDLIDSVSVDLCCSGLQLPFKNASVAALLMFDVLHHMKKVTRFFQEATRVLESGGMIVMVEPANTWWSRIVYKHFHHEDFDEIAASWELPEGDPAVIANGALPWIIFDRDYDQFQQLFPELRVVSMTKIQPLRYILSGGLTKPQLIPTRWYGLVKKIEECLPAFIVENTAMFYQIVVTRA